MSISVVSRDVLYLAPGGMAGGRPVISRMPSDCRDLVSAVPPTEQGTVMSARSRSTDDHGKNCSA